MAFKIQRVARGLGDLLNLFGGATPAELEERVRGSLELLQFYGLQQYRRESVNGAAVAEAGSIGFTVPSNQHWILYDIGLEWAQTATATGFQASGQIGPPSQTVPIIHQAPILYGAACTALLTGMMLPYPRVLLPGWQVLMRLNLLVTDATANITLNIGVGVLG